MTSLRQASTPSNVYQRTASVDIEAGGETPGRIFGYFFSFWMLYFLNLP